MPSKKIKKLFLWSLLLVYLHGIEELVRGFQDIDIFMISLGKLVGLTSAQFYWAFHTLWWVSLPTLYILFKDSKKGIIAFRLYSFAFIIELHHLIKAILLNNYYPGLATSLLYIILGVFYWKQTYLDSKKDNKTDA